MTTDMTLEQIADTQKIVVAIKNVERKTAALSFDPEDLYKQFQYHCSVKEQEQYMGVIR